LNGNNIADPSALKELQNLMWLDLSRNKVKNIAIFCSEENFLNLKYLDLQENKLAEMPNLSCPRLEYLDITNNKLEKINEGWTGHPSLKIVKAVDNKFKSIAVFKNMPKLEELWLANNNIGSLVGADGLPSLRKLHLRHNKIEKIEEEGLPELPALEYLNLRTNKIEGVENLHRIFAAFGNLKSMNFLNCPLELTYSSMNMFLGECLAKKPDI
jgi:Leucine-rich repeat (LRR) protein